MVVVRDWVKGKWLLLFNKYKILAMKDGYILETQYATLCL